MAFHDRTEAGKMLAQKIQALKIENPFVFGIARGGLVLAKEVSETLNAPLDVVLVRKLGLPAQPELGFGAIAPQNIMVLNDALVQSTKLSKETIEVIRTSEQVELARREKTYRNGKPWPNLSVNNAILVDDGIATGVSTRAAIQFLATLKPKSIIVTAPVCAADTASEISKLVSKTIFLETPGEFYAVGQFYQDFPQVTDEEVISALKAYNK